MPTECAIATCQNHAKKTETSVSYHRFPKKELNKEWIHRCKRSDTLFNPDNARICSDHFREEDFVRDLKNELLGLPQKRKLCEDAVPSLKLPCSFANSDGNNIRNRQVRVINRANKKVVLEAIENLHVQPVETEDPIFHEEVCNQCLVLGCLNNSLKQQVNDLEKSNNHLKKQNESLLNDISAKVKTIHLLTREKNTSKRTTNKKITILRNNLQSMKSELKRKQLNISSKFRKVLTEKQVHCIVKGIHRSKWKSDDISRAIVLRGISRKAYSYMRKTLRYPLPGITTMKTWTKHFKCYPGMLKEVISLMKAKASTFSENQRLTVLNFDEMKVSSEVCYDKGEDRIYGPHDYVQVVVARSIVGNWKQPVFYHFDCDMTKKILFSIIKELELSGYPVVALVCDLGVQNRAFLKEVGIGLNQKNSKNFFENPESPDRNVWCFADIPHMIKLLRNHFIDQGLELQGETFGKEVIEHILKNDCGELKLCPKLTDKHINLSSTERQRVKPAVQVFSHKVSCAIKYLQPERKIIYEFFECVDKFFDCMNSRKPRSSKKLLCGFGIHEDSQMEAIDNMNTSIESLRVSEKKNLLPFQRGILMSISSLKGLFEYCKNLGLKYVMTSRLQQDCTENLFSQLRSLGRTYDHPSPVEVKNRLKIILLGKQSEEIISTRSNCETALESETLISEGFLDHINSASKTCESTTPLSNCATSTTCIVLEDEITKQDQLFPIMSAKLLAGDLAFKSNTAEDTTSVSDSLPLKISNNHDSIVAECSKIEFSNIAEPRDSTSKEELRFVLSGSELSGLEYVAGYLAFRLKKKTPRTSEKERRRT